MTAHSIRRKVDAASSAAKEWKANFSREATATNGQPTRWQRRTYDFGRQALPAIPLFALIAGLLPRSHAAFSADPAAYAQYLASGRWEPREVLVVFLLAATGVVAIVGLAALLWRGRARVPVTVGALLGLGGTGLMLWSVGSTVIREDRLRHALATGAWSDLAFTAHVTGADAVIFVLGGATLLTVGWILLGVGVVRTPGMNRADGPLLMISAPLIFLGGMVAHVVPTMGSFLLLAAGLGILFTRGRIAISGDLRYFKRRPAVRSVASEAATGGSEESVGLASLGLAAEAEIDERTTADADPSVSVPVWVSLDGHSGNGHRPADAETANAETANAEAANAETASAEAEPDGPADAAGESDGPAPDDATPTSPAANAGPAPRPPAKSLRDRLRDARGAAISWQVSRSRANTGGAADRTVGASGRTGAGNPGRNAVSPERGSPSGRSIGRTVGNVGRVVRRPPVGVDSSRNSRPSVATAGRARPASDGASPDLPVDENGPVGDGPDTPDGLPPDPDGSSDRS
ncbi:MAG TPA: hypothetical protein VFR11_20345 [Micromonosporaceae bacterium]|jgi:hypothetical protein|nr:hypothetical protein [Micromonosporaceae bacterium]